MYCLLLSAASSRELSRCRRSTIQSASRGRRVFLPIGDNVYKKDLPIVPVGLIVANVLVFCYQMRLFFTPDTGPDDALAMVEQWGLITGTDG